MVFLWKTTIVPPFSHGFPMVFPWFSHGSIYLPTALRSLRRLSQELIDPSAPPVVRRPRGRPEEIDQPRPNATWGLTEYFLEVILGCKYILYCIYIKYARILMYIHMYLQTCNRIHIYIILPTHHIDSFFLQVCLYACMSVCPYICVYVVCMYSCMHLCMYACM